jgi:hypothetical protein
VCGGYVAHEGEKRKYYRILFQKSVEQLENLSIDGVKTVS